MQPILIEYIWLILVIIALVMLSNKFRLAYPIVLVLGGLVLSFAKVFTHVTIDPELVFFIFLPPLLYDAAWQMSWKEFWRWRRIIMSFAFPIVILTSCVIAFISNALIPGFTLALGFLLGGIISPPDAISATTIMRRVNAPKSMVNIIEGESLLNDASSLIVFRFALAAVITGQFHFSDAAGTFFLVVVAGTLIGLAVGLIFFAIYRWLPTTASLEIILSLIAPYCMYYFAERFHFSGVLAVVSGGLLLSSQRQKLLSYQSRLQGSNVWSTLGFLLNGIVFLLIGLQLPSIASQLGEIGLGEAIGYGLIISAVLIITRMACTFGAVAFTRFAGKFITVADPHPEWKAPIIFGWAGMRGVVSLAAALSIPVLISEGTPFPYRNLILFITFIVILVTLVLQGLTLPWLVRKVNMEDKYTLIPEATQELTIRKKLAATSLKFLENGYKEEIISNQQLSNLISKMRIELSYFERDIDDFNKSVSGSVVQFQRVYLEMLEEQRKTLRALNNKSEFDEDLIRKYLSLVDLEENKLRELLIRP